MLAVAVIALMAAFDVAFADRRRKGEQVHDDGHQYYRSSLPIE